MRKRNMIYGAVAAVLLLAVLLIWAYVSYGMKDYSSRRSTLVQGEVQRDEHGEELNGVVLIADMDGMERSGGLRV